MLQPLPSMPSSVKIMEVGPRDGLQNEPIIVDTPSKIRFINQLAESGLRRIEVTSFVSPQWIPPLADQLEVALGIERKPHVTYAALVPNVRGYERAMRANIDEVSIVVAASTTHNEKNLNANTKKVMERYVEVADRARADQRPFRAYVSCAFGCPYEGAIAAQAVIDLTAQLLDLGAYEIAISDTIGCASPLATDRMLDALLQQFSASALALHMHDTRGMALANIWVALTKGITSFDAAAGGLGGCPYAKGASGNVATEDLLYMLEALGIETNVSLEKLCQASLAIESIVQKRMPSKIVAAYRAERNSSC